MDSYIEVSFIIQVLMIVLSLLYSSVIVVKPIAMKMGLFYACIISLYANVCWKWYAWYGMIVIEFIFFIYYFRMNRLTYICAYVIRIAMMLTNFWLVRGGFHCLLWYAPIQKRVIWIFLSYVFSYILYKVKWQKVCVQSHYIYLLHIYLKEQSISVKGYLDSGNLIVYQKQPIIFIDERYKAYFENYDIQWIQMQTIQAQSLIQAYEVLVSLNDSSKQKVWICISNQLHLPWHCEALLNINMIQTG